MMLHAVVRHCPQLAMKCHYLLAVTGLALMSYHVWMRQSKCLWCLVATEALWIFLTLVSLAVPIRGRWGHSWPLVVISRHHKLLGIDITMLSGWRVEPGQYVYLWLPQAGLRVASQLPLSYVSSWEDASKRVHTAYQHTPPTRIQVCPYHLCHNHRPFHESNPRAGVPRGLIVAVLTVVEDELEDL
jgi:hypothetical protein